MSFAFFWWCLVFLARCGLILRTSSQVLMHFLARRTSATSQPKGRTLEQKYLVFISEESFGRGRSGTVTDGRRPLVDGSICKSPSKRIQDRPFCLNDTRRFPKQDRRPESIDFFFLTRELSAGRGARIEPIIRGLSETDPTVRSRWRQAAHFVFLSSNFFGAIQRHSIRNLRYEDALMLYVVLALMQFGAGLDDILTCITDSLCLNGCFNF